MESEKVNVRELTDILWSKYSLFSERFEDKGMVDNAITALIDFGIMIIPEKETFNMDLGEYERIEKKVPTMKSLDADKKSAKSENSTSTAAPEKEEVIDFSKVKVEPLFEEFVDFDTFSKSDFRAVKVKACEAVKKSKKLLQFTLDDGTGTDRTILSGIHAYYEPEELVGKTLIAITNLPPRAMMGIESCGMLLSAIHEEEGEEKLHLLMVDNHIPAGAKLY